MKKVIKDVDDKKGVVQVTIADERWYIRDVTNPITGIPEFKFVPSATWIASCYPKGIGYFKWLAEKGWDEAEAIKQAAGDKGTKVHKAIEAVMRGEEVRIDSKFINPSTDREEELTLDECDCILSFIAWRKEMETEYVFETVVYETVLWSDQHNVAGTVDWIVKLTNKETGEVKFYLIDFKTSQYIWKSHEIQVSLYKEIVSNGENHFVGLDASKLEAAILQLGYKKNKAGFKFVPIANKFNLFLTSKQIWQEEHGGEQPNKKDYPIILSPGIKPEEVVIEEPKTFVADEIWPTESTEESPKIIKKVVKGKPQ